MRQTNETLIQIYMTRWKGTPPQLFDALRKESWFSAEEAVAVGLADGVSDKISLAASISPERKNTSTCPTTCRLRRNSKIARCC